MHLHGTHLLGDILTCALYQLLAEVGGQLCPRIGGDVDAAAERAAHVGGNLPHRIHLHRAGDEDTLLPVRVIDRKLHRQDSPLMLYRGDFDAKAFALHTCRTYHHGISGDNPFGHGHRLQQAQLHRLPVRHALRSIDTRRYGVLVRYPDLAHSGVETIVSLLRMGGDEILVAHRLSESGHHLLRHLFHRSDGVLPGLAHSGMHCLLFWLSSILTAHILCRQFV